MASSVSDDGARSSEVLQVHDALRDAILRGEIKPHEPLSQLRLADAYGISRTPLREALRMLEREGLITSEPRRRARVAPVSAQDVEQIYALRITLESLAIRLTVPKLDAGALASIKQELDAMDGCADEHAFEPWEVHHAAFHRGLVQEGGDRLLRTIQELFEHSERYRRVYLAEPRQWMPAAADHTSIFEACERGDEVRASVLLATHLARTALAVVAIADPNRDPAPVRMALRIVTDSADVETSAGERRRKGR